MKKILLALGMIAMAQLSNAQPPEGPATPGSVYGAPVSEKGAQKIEKIPGQLEKKDSFSTKIIATVVDVCPKKGCWINLKVDENTTAFVKMKDYGFFVPTDLKGKTIVLEGEAFLETTSVDELRHYAKDAKKPQSEIDAITEPKQEIRFLASGIRVVK